MRVCSFPGIEEVNYLKLVLASTKNKTSWQAYNFERWGRKRYWSFGVLVRLGVLVERTLSHGDGHRRNSLMKIVTNCWQIVLRWRRISRQMFLAKKKNRKPIVIPFSIQQIPYFTLISVLLLYCIAPGLRKLSYALKIINCSCSIDQVSLVIFN